MQGCKCINCLSSSTISMAIASARLLVLWRMELPIEGKAPTQVKKSWITPFPIILPLSIRHFLVCKMGGSSIGSSKASKFPMLLLLSLSMITSPVSDIVAANTRSKRKERWRGKRGQIKRQGWSGGEENERQMANNVMRGRWVCDGYLVCLDLSEDLPGNGARNPSCYLLSTALVFPWRGKGDAAK